MNLVPIGEVTVRATSANPAKLTSHTFCYIDLSSVDQNAKEISAPKVLPAQEAPSRARQVVAHGDVLVSTVRPNLNGVARVSPVLEGAIASTGFTVLRSKRKLIDSNYLFHWVKSPAFISDMVSKSTGASYPAVSDKIVRESLIPLPTAEEQRRIAAILDKADELRAKRRQAIAHLDALIQSIFQSMFGDPVQNPFALNRKPLTEVGRLYSGGTPSKEIPGNWIGNTPWFSPKDLKRVKLHDSIDHISSSVPLTSSLRLLPAGTVIFVVRGMILAHSFPVAMIMRDATINQDLKALLPYTDVSPEFLLACLRAQENYVVGLVETAAHGTKKVTTETLGKIWVFDVSPQDQQAFAYRVAAVERLKETHQKHLAELDALFASLQSRAFKGEL